MNGSGNGRKPDSRQSGDERPWWHSGSHCLAALFWVFTLSIVWHALLSDSGMAWATAIFGLTLAVLQSSMSSARGKSR